MFMKITQESILAAFKALKGNIEMFERYVQEFNREGDSMLLNTYKEYLDYILKFQQNQIGYDDLPWQATMYFYEAPSLFTKGT